jgi:hypothetical protein
MSRLIVFAAFAYRRNICAGRLRCRPRRTTLVAFEVYRSLRRRWW